MESSFNALDKVLGRLEDLDKVHLNALIPRLVRERAFLKTILQTIQEGILLLDETGQVIYANEVARQMIGMKPEDTQPIWKWIPELHEIVTKRTRSDATENFVAVHEVGLRYPKPRILKLYVKSFDANSPEAAKSLHARLMLILNDITEEKRLTEEYIEQEKLSSLFMLAGGVAHEIGNPLNAIKIHLELIGRQLKALKLLSLKSVHNNLQVCHDEVERLEGILRHFLEAIRPIKPNLKELTLEPILADTLRFHDAELKKARIRLEVEEKKPTPSVFADVDQMRQVFYNLIKNACEAMLDGKGVLRIRLHHDNAWVYVAFEDNGKGIPAEDLVRISEPYFSRKEQGHGLGLMIVQRIVSAHAGSLSFESKLHEGTTACVKLPRAHVPLPRLPIQDQYSH